MTPIWKWELYGNSHELDNYAITIHFEGRLKALRSIDCIKYCIISSINRSKLRLNWYFFWILIICVVKLTNHIWSLLSFAFIWKKCMRKKYVLTVEHTQKKTHKCLSNKKTIIARRKSILKWICIVLYYIEPSATASVVGRCFLFVVVAIMFLGQPS